MKDFAKPKGRLRALAFHARLAYSVFLIFTLAGFVITGWLADDMVSVDLERVDDYYAGVGPEPPPAEAAAASLNENSGPELELPDEVVDPVLDLSDDGEVPTAGGMAMSQRKLLEVTHFHLFTMPVYLMILSHLFMLSRIGSWFKSTVISLAAVGTALHIAAPWVATSGSTTSVVFYGVSGSVMMISYITMSGMPLWEMWAPVASEGSTRSSLVARELADAE